MTGLLYSIVYGSVVLFVAGSAVRAVRYARSPRHLRWELHPIPRVRWRAMAGEVLLLRGVWRFNRRLWFRSFPFHVGLYLFIASLVLVMLRVLAGTVVPGIIAGVPGDLLAGASRVAGMLGLALVPLGALGLLVGRLAERRLRAYTTSGDLANLAAFIVAFVTLGIGCADPGFGGATAFVRGLLAFDTSVRVPPLTATGLAFGALLAAYIPFTHMSHFIAKYFTYHAVRWDAGLGHARDIAAQLAWRPRWAAPHVRADGTRSWADIAAANPAEEARR